MKCEQIRPFVLPDAKNVIITMIMRRFVVVASLGHCYLTMGSYTNVVNILQFHLYQSMNKVENLLE
jgi:hypothetical protein